MGFEEKAMVEQRTVVEVKKNEEYQGTLSDVL